MSTIIKTAGSILALAILAACGGGDGDSGSSGGGGNGGGAGGGGTPPPKYTKQQMEWVGHESVYTALGVTQIPGFVANLALDFFSYAAEEKITTDSGTCDGESAGTLVATLTDANGDGLVSNGDKVVFDFNDCYLESEDLLLDGTVTVTFSGVSGNVLDETASSAVTMTLPLTGFKLDGSETLDGTIVVAYKHDNKGTASDDDDTYAYKTTVAQLDIARSEGGKSYATRIENYLSDYVYDYVTDLNTFSAISYGASGTDPLLGSFDYDVTMTTPLVYWEHSEGGELQSGAFKSVTVGETITTTFVQNDTRNQVKIESTSGLSSTMDFIAFDDL